MYICFNTASTASIGIGKGGSHRCHNQSPRSRRNVVMQSKRSGQPVILFVTPDRFSQDVAKAVQLTKAVLDGGVSLVQIRDRKGTPEDVANVTKALIAADVPTNKLVINGMPPKAVLAMNDGLGVHIKEKDIPAYLPQAKEMMPQEAVVGCAVHKAEIAKQAADIYMPDYFQVGTMFATMSHPGKIPEGPSLLTEIREAVGDSPKLIGIGGIEPENVGTITEHGGDGVAVVTLLAAAENPTETARSLFERCQQAYGSKPVS